MKRSNSRRRAQAMVEMAIVLPLIVMMMLGAADLGRAFYLDIEMTGASRAGMREGIQGTASDLGNSVRNEVFDAIDNTQAVWGSTGPAGAYDGCGPARGGRRGPPGLPPNPVHRAPQALFAVVDS